MFLTERLSTIPCSVRVSFQVEDGLNERDERIPDSRGSALSSAHVGARGRRSLVDVAAPVTLRAVLDVLEANYPMLRGTIREYETGNRRAFLRFFACEEDWSLESPDKELPDAIASGREPLLIIGAIAGG